MQHEIAVGMLQAELLAGVTAMRAYAVCRCTDLSFESLLQVLEAGMNDSDQAIEAHQLLAQHCSKQKSVHSAFLIACGEQGTTC